MFLVARRGVAQWDGDWSGQTRSGAARGPPHVSTNFLIVSLNDSDIIRPDCATSGWITFSAGALPIMDKIQPGCRQSAGPSQRWPLCMTVQPVKWQDWTAYWLQAVSGAPRPPTTSPHDVRRLCAISWMQILTLNSCLTAEY